MRKGILFMLLCLISIVAVACGGGNNSGSSDGDGGECTGGECTGGEDTGGEDTGGEDTGSDDGGESSSSGNDYWDRYVSSFKEGRTWTYEMQGGVKQKNEVVSVSDTEAKVESTTIMNGNPMGEPTTTPYPLTQTTTDGSGDGSAAAPEWQEKEVTCKAGTFEAISTDGETWMMKKHPVIIVKSAAMELAEFKD